jgi:hypothetical protein
LRSAVSRLENEDALDRMAARLGQRPDILARRREIVEHPFGTLKNERLNKTAKPWKRPGCSMKASAAAGKKTWLS